MDYVTLGRTEIKVCKNGFGALPIQRISFDSAKEILLHAYNSGINFTQSHTAHINPFTGAHLFPIQQIRLLIRLRINTANANTQKCS